MSSKTDHPKDSEVAARAQLGMSNIQAAEPQLDLTMPKPKSILKQPTTSRTTESTSGLHNALDCDSDVERFCEDVGIAYELVNGKKAGVGRIQTHDSRDF